RISPCCTVCALAITWAMPSCLRLSVTSTLCSTRGLTPTMPVSQLPTPASSSTLGSVASAWTACVTEPVISWILRRSMSITSTSRPTSQSVAATVLPKRPSPIPATCRRVAISASSLIRRRALPGHLADPHRFLAVTQPRRLRTPGERVGERQGAETSDEHRRDQHQLPKCRLRRRDPRGKPDGAERGRRLEDGVNEGEGFGDREHERGVEHDHHAQGRRGERAHHHRHRNLALESNDATPSLGRRDHRRREERHAAHLDAARCRAGRTADE